MQGFKSPEDGFDDPETCENSIYTDDYQTEDAFAQIPASNEFVEEETQEISSIEDEGPKPRISPSEAFPTIQKLETFRPKPEKGKKAKRPKKGKGEEGLHRLKAENRRAGFKKFAICNALSPALENLFSSLKKSSKEIAVVAAGTAILSGCLLILGFASLHA
ncbi:MAG: hypothetical protein IKS61_02430 [Aeriscardovia sp.]|nr:hypothetical protein [Aeriscardovia sp.]